MSQGEHAFAATEVNQLHEVKKLSLKVEALTIELNTLKDVVKKLVQGEGIDVVVNKAPGGRTSVSDVDTLISSICKAYRRATSLQAAIRFHVSVMLGLDNETDALPAPTASVDKQTWNFQVDLDNVVIPDQSTSLASVLRIPGGPGH